MVMDASGTLRSVVALWRYPVKSMMGEELTAADMTPQGVLGDRAYAIVESSTGKVASAKNPRKWGRLFDCRATYMELPRVGASNLPVRMTLPDGSLVTSEMNDLDATLSQVLGRAVHLSKTAPEKPTLEEYWPNVEGRAHHNVVTDEAMPAGAFFDAAAVHLITTATLDRLRELYPPGRFEARRFRPNLVLGLTPGESGFAENVWVGRTLCIGKDVQLRVTGPCVRCVMTTLPQGDLPQDVGILRAAVQHNASAVGVYATVLRAGRICRGDSLRLD